MRSAPTIFTVGHSTHPLETLVAMLKAHDVKTVADVRRFPRSRKFPQFNDDALAVDLPGHGLHYVPFPALGGRRRPAKDSVNAGWRSEGFRGYADYMQTPAFESALAALERLASQQPTAIMCAEAVPWRCHRSLISDALLVRGWKVIDITSKTAATPHDLASFAKVDGLKITYPQEAEKGSPGLFE